jgi:N-methylhydantoinase A
MPPMPPESGQTVLVGVDIGGTFTDIVAALPDGRMISAKVPSTPADFSLGICDGLRQLFADHGGLAPVVQINHGTTVATNCVLERKGARTALITTAGFRDVLEIGRLRLPVLYDLQYDKPVSLIERHWRLEVGERIDAQGKVLQPLSEDDVLRHIDHMLEKGIEAVAVCLLNSYANPEHERAIGRLLARHPGLHYTLSSDLLREIGEYERTSTAMLNAYLMPVVSAYLDKLRGGLGGLGFKGDLMVMGSNGGLMDLEAASAKPAFMIESGPAAGVIAAQAMGKVSGYPNVITFDMGGTTAKASIVENGQVSESPELEVGGGISYGRKLIGGGGYPVRATVVDLAEVGAGGGSIVWFDQAGGLHVGPQSTGAVPGPACYGRGGTLPTVTDACSVLGYIGDAIAGGSVPIYRDRARVAITSHLQERLAKPVHDIAYGIYQIAAANMMRAIKAVSIERGRDPRDFGLIAFGGNGALFATEIASSMLMSTVIIPPLAGLFSVIGLLAADAKNHLVISIKRTLNALQPGEFAALVAAQEHDYLARFEPLRREVAAVERVVDLRYAGQNYHLGIPVPSGPLAEDAHLQLIAAFHEAHLKTYGHNTDSEPVELQNLRLTVIERAGIASEGLARMAQSTRPLVSGSQQTGSRQVYFGPRDGWQATTVLPGRSRLNAAGSAGPVIIEEYDATILIPPGWTARLDGHQNVVLTRQGQDHG